MLIVGAGIVGLTAGGCLSRAGFEVLVCERSERLRADGAGITLWPNALDIFETLGVGERIVAAGASWGPNARLVEKDGTTRPFTAAGTEAVEEMFGWPIVLIYRPTLSQILSDTLPAGALRFSAELVELKQTDDAVTAYFADGSSESADLVIGADGIWSRVRRWVDADAEPEFTDQVMWRGVVNDSAVTQSVVGLSGPIRTAYFPMGSGLVYWVIGEYGRVAGESHPSPFEEALEVIADWDEIAKMVSRTAEADVIRTDVFRLTGLRTWHAGRVALAGDAAHAESPHIMIGACLGVEDAYELTRALSTEEDPRTAMSSYSSARRERLSWTQSEAARIATLPAEANGPALQELRETLLRTAPVSPGSTRLSGTGAPEKDRPAQRRTDDR